MGPLRSLDSVFSKYFTIKGRASRSEFWWYSSFQSLAMFTAIGVDIVLFDPATTSGLWSFATVWIFLLTMIPNLTVAIRRLHDTGRSGMWMFITMVPFIGGMWYLVLLVLPSEQDDNIYGPPPGMRRRATYGEGTGGVVRPAKSNPFAAYAHLEASRNTPSADLQAQRRAQIEEYYRTKVVKAV